MVSSTDSHEVLLSRDTVMEAARSRNGCPLVIVDIAVPRDADPAVGDIPGVTLLDLDDLESVSRANRDERGQEVAAVEHIIDEEMLRFRVWWESRSLDPSIARLEAHAEALRLGEVAKTLRQMPHLGSGGGGAHRNDEQGHRAEAAAQPHFGSEGRPRPPGGNDSSSSG